jgi:hypothetical protein
VAPTIDRTAYDRSFIYKAYYSSQQVLTSKPNGVVFGQYLYQGAAYFAGCSDWIAFQSQLQLPLSDQYFSSLAVETYSYDFAKMIAQNNNTYVCSDKSLIFQITAALMLGTTLTSTCNGHNFHVFKCSGTISFCVDCSASCQTVTSCPSSGQMTLNPCLTCSQTTTGSYFLIGLTFAESVLYPQLQIPLRVSVAQRQISLQVSVVNNTGTIYCAALVGGVPVASTTTIQQNSTAVSVFAKGNVSLVLTNLVPVTKYDIYCYSQDFTNHIMPLSTALSTLVTRTSLCCRAVSFPTLATMIIEASSYSSQSSVNILKLEALPPNNVKITLILKSYLCPWQINGTKSVASAVPSFSNFTSSSTSASFSFIVLGTPGCYLLAALVSGTDRLLYSTTNSSIVVRSSKAAPDAPKLQSAVFSNDGLKLYVTLDSASDKGATVISNYASAFICSQLVSFAGSGSASCIWSAANVVTATISSSGSQAPNSLVEVKSNVTLLANRIKAVCSYGLVCAYANASSVVVIAPSNPIIPSIQLTTATTIGGCDSIVMDPTTSTGGGGRSWKSLVWSVSGVGSSITLANTTSITAYLSSKYLTTTSLVTIPQNMVSFGSYTVGLMAKNFLGQAGFQQVTVVVSDSNVVPRLTIVGSATVNTYRSQAFSVSANASFPACITTSVSLQYTWSLFQGASLQYGVSSYAKDPRFYRLTPYSLAASTSYLLRVSVSTVSSPSVSLTTAQIVVNVGVYGVTALVAGGAVQTFGAGSTVALDASPSQDLDYPGASLSYQWGCVEVSPNFGNLCRNFSKVATTGSSIRVLSSVLAEAVSQTQLKVNVLVSNAAGVSSAASVTVIVLNVLTPVVAIQSSKTIFNVGDTVTISALLSSTLAVQASWDILDSTISLTSVSKNSKISRVFSSVGYNGFDLAIIPNSLVAGLRYTFQLSANYIGFDVSAFTQVTVSMNSPPSGGDVTVTPATGTALSTMFFMVTVGWVDDASDYPFSYVFSYFSTKLDNSIVVKNLDSKSYASSLLGQGLAMNDFMVTCVALVMDVNNGSSTALRAVSVSPAVNISALSAQTTASLQNALSSYDPSAVAQIIGATTSSVNAANCSVGVPCWSLFRENCSYTDLTCGPCLTGYIGVPGASNIACFSLENAPPAISCTTTDASMCASRKCGDGGVCEEVDKPCKNNCTSAENGECVFYDVNNIATGSCSQSDGYCRAECSCRERFYGSDCSMSEAELLSVQAVRDALCVGLYKTIRIQDVSQDVILSRATSVSNILLDISELSDTGFGNCTAALVETINSDPILAGSEVTALLCMEALSSILQRGSSLSAGLATNISNALTALSNGIQSNMAVGQVSVAFTTANVRLTTSVETASDIGSLSFAPPQTDYEAYLKSNVSSLTLNTSVSGLHSNLAVGVTVLQYTSNPHGRATASRSTGFQLSAYRSGSAAPELSRRLSVDSSIGVTMSLINIENEEYYSFDAVNSSVFCVESAVAYNVSVECPIQNQSIVCGGQFAGFVNFTCPAVSVKPQCRYWDGLQYSISGLCRVESYTSARTNCLCYSSTPNVVDDDVGSGGSGGSDHSELNEISSSADMVVGGFVNTFTSAGKLSLASLTHNAVIFSVCVFILCISFLGLSIAIRVDRRELVARNSDLAEAAVKRFDELILSWRPEELSEVPWYVKLWRKVIAEHEWISLFSGYHSIEDYRTTKCIECVGLIINFLFVDTVMAVLFFFDDGTCETYTSKIQCLTQTSLDQQDTLCLWDGQACSFNPNIGQTFTSTLILTGIITAIAIPFELFFSSMVEAIRDYCCIMYIRKDCSIQLPDDGLRMDIDAFQTRRGRLFRAARLLKMHEMMDDISVKEEAKLLHAQIEHDVQRPVNELLEIQWSIPNREPAEEAERKGRTSETIEATKLRSTSTQERWVSVIHSMATKSWTSHHFTEVESVESLQKKIDKAREHEQQIISLIENSDSVFVQNKILMQQFCANLLTGFRKGIARRVFAHSARESTVDRVVGFYHYFSLFMFPCYVLGTCFYIFLFGIRLGSRSTNTWLLGGLVSLAEEILLLAPVKVYLRHFAMSSIIVSDIKVVFQQLQRKAKLIMCRTSGLMRSANGMVHHLNPACRAARHYPRLTVSRLLISITDDDLPRNLAAPHSLTALSCMHLSSLVVILCIASLPDFFQDVLFESTAVSGVGGMLILLAEVTKISIAIPTILVFVFVICPLVCLLWVHFKHVHLAVQAATSGVHEASPVEVDLESPAKHLEAPEAVGLPVVVAVQWKSLLEGSDRHEEGGGLTEHTGSPPVADSFRRKKYVVSREFRHQKTRVCDVGVFADNGIVRNSKVSTLFEGVPSLGGSYRTSDLTETSTGRKVPNPSQLSYAASVSCGKHDEKSLMLNPTHEIKPWDNISCPISPRAASPMLKLAKTTRGRRSKSPVIRIPYRSPSRAVLGKAGPQISSPKSTSLNAFVPLSPAPIKSSVQWIPDPESPTAVLSTTMPFTPVQHTISFDEFVGELDAAELGAVMPSSPVAPQGSVYLTLNDMMNLSSSKSSSMLPSLRRNDS